MILQTKALQTHQDNQAQIQDKKEGKKNLKDKLSNKKNKTKRINTNMKKKIGMIKVKIRTKERKAETKAVTKANKEDQKIAHKPKDHLDKKKHRDTLTNHRNKYKTENKGRRGAVQEAKKRKARRTEIKANPKTIRKINAKMTRKSRKENYKSK